MKTAADIMTPDPVTVTPETTLREAARLLLEGHFNGLPVVEDGRLAGLITRSDLVSLGRKVYAPGYFLLLGGAVPLQLPGRFEHAVERMTATTVGEVMTAEPCTVSPGTSLEDLATTMVERRWYSLPVVEGERLVGIVGMEDLFRQLAEPPHDDYCHPL